MKARHDIDASRVFVTGLSAGGAMTAVMLADYPDVFAAGAVVAGIPFGCGTGLSAAFTCMSAPPQKSAAEWAALVNAASSSSSHPRVAVWAGDADHTVSPHDADALVAQWTAVHGLDASAPTSTSATGRATFADFGPAGALPIVERVRIAGMDHGTPVDPAAGCGTAGAFILDVGVCSSRAIFAFFGLVPRDPALDPGANPGSDPGSDPGASDPGASDPGASDPGTPGAPDVPGADGASDAPDGAACASSCAGVDGTTTTSWMIALVVVLLSLRTRSGRLR
jgi:hypothetical protein